jgi:hypothetical protein
MKVKNEGYLRIAMVKLEQAQEHIKEGLSVDDDEMHTRTDIYNTIADAMDELDAILKNNVKRG